ncbi:pimeloyl-CoA dehydrogenase large subunit [Paracoccus aestuarii]|uniref:Pimeloyl-CoA dehydrogenase large subunit n=1 Tax=Paracoccus aestuarii TaxID=453842 RepID=A0A418ZVN9_9RHOB|nr:acyl-CoA dehydrogenase family protein [Paracoccus aestuarii]RJL02895.1 pimeloyl-CoA dehydrogenase large subunit [Paracoccus aestuarii]WCQ98952.1 acyl-CoA dehydrogenase family protein [Paracoccus aestuarii]
MDMSFTPEETAFRDEIRAFLKAELDPALARKVRLHHDLTKAEMEGWHAKLQSRGWLAGNWPKEFGGAGWTAIQRHIFEEESARAHAPRIVPFGIAMLGPVLQKFGSKEQQDHWLPRILNGDDWWCQGYSEPGAGSDLAGLRCEARRDGDHYVVNGQKTWTTLGQHANMIFCLVRTSTEGKKQEGISFLLIDMETPGVTVRPIVLLDGAAEVNEVWFDNVRVPAANLVGTENEGWTYAKYLLTHERTNIAGVGFATAALDNLKRVARAQIHRGKPLSEDPAFAADMASVEIELMAMSTTNLRMLSAAAQGQAPGIESSMLKIKGTQIRQRLDALTRRAYGGQAMALPQGGNEGPEDADEALAATATWLNNRKLSIYGGSNEIQRSIIAGAMAKG